MPSQDLPTAFPIFPLPNLVLFPHTRVPLHVFEPRYRQMTADALDQSRIIGMVLIREGDPMASPMVYEVGCAGRILDAQQLPDGRYNILLEALRRFRIRRELKLDKLYRTVEADALPDPEFRELEESLRRELEGLRGALEQGLLGFARDRAPGVEATLRKRLAALDPVQLVHALCFGLDCEFVEKQSLLEAADPLARARLLAKLIAFRNAASRLSESPKTLN